MTMGWHTVMEFVPSLIGCMITSGNPSFGMIKASEECVINIPTCDLAEQVVGIGNRTRRENSLPAVRTVLPRRQEQPLPSLGYDPNACANEVAMLEALFFHDLKLAAGTGDAAMPFD